MTKTLKDNKKIIKCFTLTSQWHHIRWVNYKYDIEHNIADHIK
ncbi:MAG: hypothetical protein K0Q97_1642 [Bacillota bacterium]|jgi:hypothetical protein|nr:hypothetical protein [Bacillota bacterium]